MKTITISSNSGRHELSIQVSDGLADRAASIRYRSGFPVQTHPLEAEASRDLLWDVGIHQFVLSRNGLRNLQSALSAWLASYAHFTVDLEGERSQIRLSLGIGRREDMIYSHTHPALSVVAHGHFQRFEIAFVIDPSCVALAMRDIESLLADDGVGNQ